jgi:hypothetical protein
MIGGMRSAGGRVGMRGRAGVKAAGRRGRGVMSKGRALWMVVGRGRGDMRSAEGRVWSIALLGVSGVYFRRARRL